jgi:predicted lipase
LDSTLFPGLSSSILVHQGFANEQAKTAQTILAAVLTLLSQHSASSVVVTGHSLGAALALLDSVYLPLHVPAGTRVRTITYGMPRVGNAAFANYVDANNGDLTHINNKKDPIPIVPGESLGYVHPSGEVHIQDSGSWVACSGQDNPSDLCIVGDEPTLLQGNLSDHDGPYDDGIVMGTGKC